jgi:Carboxypeptidase regulatory-like domain
MPTPLILAFLSFITATSITATSFLLAQTATGVIRGNVQDRTGAVIINVDVRLVDEATKQSWEQTTNEEGLFEFRALLIGKYRVDAEHPRFRKEVNQNIAL